MEFVAASWCTVKYLRLIQTKRNFTCGDLNGNKQIVKERVDITLGLI